MSRASTVETENREMLQTAVADRKLSDAQVRVMLMRALDGMSTYQMNEMVKVSLDMTLDEFYF